VLSPLVLFEQPLVGLKAGVPGGAKFGSRPISLPLR
jgi:hypothetical protein